MTFMPEDLQLLTDLERNAYLERRLKNLRDDLRSPTNSVRGFAYVRANYPELLQELYVGRDLRWTDLRNSDLRDIDFRGADFTGCDFTGAMIVGARFEQAKLSRDILRAAKDWQEHVDNWKVSEQALPRWLSRAPGERFSFSPCLPELVILSPDLLVHARNNEPSEFDHSSTVLRPQERQLLKQGRLAIAVRCLTSQEWSQVADPNNIKGRQGEAAVVQGYAARAYCNSANERAKELGLPPGTAVDLPSMALFYHLAAAGAGSAGVIEPDRTDLTLGDLRVGGAKDFEFTRDLAANIQRAGFNSSGHRNVRNVFFRPPDGPALVRPLFLLGGDDL